MTNEISKDTLFYWIEQEKKKEKEEKRNIRIYVRTCMYICTIWLEQIDGKIVEFSIRMLQRVQKRPSNRSLADKKRGMISGK